MSVRTVLISGAGIAGPAVAYWLGRYGFRATVVEQAPAPRTAGSAVDFRGPTQLTVLGRMGVLEKLRALDTGGSPIAFVDETGRELARLPANFAGGDLEILRGDLSRVLRERSLDVAEYRFGTTVTSLRETPDAVRVAFSDGSTAEFDILVGADGIHSGVRALAFGPEERFVRHQGHYVATWSLDNVVGAGTTALMFNTPGRMASVGADHRDPTRASALFAFASPKITTDRRDADVQRRILAENFRDMGWWTSRLLATLADAPDLYLDSISRVDVPRWSRGRVVLLGDAGYGATLGGMGVGTAVVAAYVLATELAVARGDHIAAFARYEARLRRFVTRTQKGGANTGRFLAPRTATGIRLRNWFVNSGPGRRMLLKEAEERSTLQLPDVAPPLPEAAG